MFNLATRVVTVAKQRKVKIALAESCTGGLVSFQIVSIPGSSDIFDCSFVTYSYESKSTILKIPIDTLRKYGAVSKEVAAEMVVGVIKMSNADIALAVTGIAGPSGALPNKPVGLVHFATFEGGTVQNFEIVFKGDRHSIQHQACEYALNLLLNVLDKVGGPY